MRLLAAEPRSIAGLLCPSRCLCGTILVTPCSMVWDWRVSRAGPMSFYWPSCSLTFCLLLFSLSLLSFYALVLWGLGLRTDRVLIRSLPALHCQPLLIIIIIMDPRLFFTHLRIQSMSPNHPWVLTTCNRELISILEVRIKKGDLNLRPHV